jgi:hypothetical protein
MARGATAKDKAANRSRAPRTTRRQKTKTDRMSKDARSRSQRNDERKAQRRQPASPVKARSVGRRRAEAGRLAGKTHNKRERAANLAAQRDAR